MRRPIVAVIGNAIIPHESAQADMARQVGRIAIELGCRLQTGGLSSLPRLVAEGARGVPSYRDGDLIALSPTFNPDDGYADVVIPTGMDIMRNTLVASGDIVVAIGGGAGTLSEIALAWQLNRTILSWKGQGWSKRMAGVQVDMRRDDAIIGFDTAKEFEQRLKEALEDLRPRHQGIRE